MVSSSPLPLAFAARPVPKIAVIHEAPLDPMPDLGGWPEVFFVPALDPQWQDQAALADYFIFVPRDCVISADCLLGLGLAAMEGAGFLLCLTQIQTTNGPRLAVPTPAPSWVPPEKEPFPSVALPRTHLHAFSAFPQAHRLAAYVRQQRQNKPESCNLIGRVLLTQTQDVFTLDTGTAPRSYLLNDIGHLYGAGIAQIRLANSLIIAGHAVEMVALSRYPLPQNGEAYPLPVQDVLDDVAAFAPDYMWYGNFHGARGDASLLKALGARTKGFWILHDLWLLTGKCIYTEGCTKFKTGCDATCPVAADYPSTPPDKIADAWRDKKDLMQSASAPTLVTCSPWAEAFANEATEALGLPNKALRLDLPLPVDVFAPQDKKAAREALGLPLDKTILMFSASGFNSARKGLSFIRGLMQHEGLKDCIFMLVGYLPPAIIPTLPPCVRHFGYDQKPSRQAQMFAAADLFVGPNLEETLGQVYIEAASCGIPSIGFEVTGVAHAITNGITGLFAGSQTVDSLFSAIQRALEPATYAALSFWARQHSLNKRSWAACALTALALTDEQKSGWALLLNETKPIKLRALYTPPS